VNREHIMAVLYDLILVIGGEVKVRPLLSRTLQRLLYHTSFPAGLVTLDRPGTEGATALVRIDAAVGDYGLADRVGERIEVPSELLGGAAALIEDPDLLGRLPCARPDYRVGLRLPIDGCGLILLLATRMPHTELPLTRIFQPVLANLAKAILLCRHNEAYTAALASERNQAELALRKANRALKTLSACNAALVRIEREEDLLGEICALVVTQGGHRLAWVGYGDEAEPDSLRRVAAAGDDCSYLAELRLSLDPHNPLGQGPVGRAMRSGVPQPVRDIDGDPSFRPWRESARRCGIASMVALPLLDAGHRAFGVLAVYSQCADTYDGEEMELLAELADDLAFGIRALRAHRERERLEEVQLRSAERLQRALNGTVQAMAQTVEMRDPYTAGHQQRVARLTAAMARELGWPEDRIEGVRLGASIHDIGKIRVPAEILSRPGLLSPEEMALIRTHPAAGYEVLREVELPWPVAQMILQHHERLDGSGYPQGLKGGDILEEARLLAVADVVESMASHRPYRAPRGIDAAFAEILGQRGRLYDPAAADACLRLFRERGFSFD
jgi:putative nucleotidyltransferase with HDIG domain